jgi:hypothetical protein
MSNSSQKPGFSEKPGSSARRQRREDDRSYLWMVIFTLVVVGGGLIALIWGPTALLTALPCLLGGAGLIFIPWGLLTAVEKWRNRIE